MKRGVMKKIYLAVIFLVLGGVAFASKRIETQLFEFRSGVKLGEDGETILSTQIDGKVAETNPAAIYSAPAVEEAMRYRVDWAPVWLTANDGTVTVSRTTANLQAYKATNSFTIAVQDSATGVVSSINFILDINGQSITWLTNNVEYSETPSTSGVVNVVYYSPLFKTNWTGTIIGD